MGKAPIGAVRDLKAIDPKTIPHVLVEGEMGAALEYMVSDTKTGKVTEHVIKRSESYVQQFLQWLWCAFVGNGTSSSIQIRDTGNTLRNIYQNDFNNMANNAEIFGDVNAGAGTTSYGIVVGTGAVAPTIADYALGTLIAHGVGAGQLQYSVHSFGAPAADATTSQLTITRNFANGSGGAITVNEIGLYCQVNDTGNTIRYIMLIRDVTGGVAVPNGQTLTVNYRPQAVV